MAGTANLARFSSNFPQSISPVLEALETSDHAADYCPRCSRTSAGVAVRDRSGVRRPAGKSLRGGQAGYGPRAASKVGVVGPTRMDYPTTMASVRAVARYLSRNLGD
ncbi:hypothetical protein QJS66_03665 [Kocuria rhizophila]|nr:hypothetical protein QJS66_03665 [Kocuria rhizophila]